MATSWPTTDDVKHELRLQPGDTQDDGVVEAGRLAAVAWIGQRCQTKYTDPADPAALFLPDPLFMACLLEAARLYRRRDSVDGTIGWGDMGVVRVGPKDPDIETMLAPYLQLVI